MRENLGIDMATMKSKNDFEKNPTLHEILIIEKVLQDHNESTVTISQLKKILLGKINENKIIIILDYLQEENRIVVSSRGITWIKNDKLALLLNKSELTEKDAFIIGDKIKHEIAKKHNLVKRNLS